MICKSCFHDWLLVFMEPTACPAIYKNSKLLDILPTQKHIVPWLLLLLLYHLSGNPFPSWFLGLIPTHHPRVSSGAIVSTKTPWICLHLATCAPTALYIEIAVVLVLFPNVLRQKPSSTTRVTAERAVLNESVLTCTASLLANMPAIHFRKEAPTPMSFSSFKQNWLNGHYSACPSSTSEGKMRF